MISFPNMWVTPHSLHISPHPAFKSHCNRLSPCCPVPHAHLILVLQAWRVLPLGTISWRLSVSHTLLLLVVCTTGSVPLFLPQVLGTQPRA